MTDDDQTIFESHAENHRKLRAERKATSAAPCLNCGDPSDELFCGMCREMGCTISRPHLESGAK